MNAPGTTVLVESGTLDHHGTVWDFIDTPGTASLDSLSPDEEVASQAAMGRAGYAAPDVIVGVLDATSPSKSLYLISQLKDLGYPLVIAVTMLDLVRTQQSSISIAELSRLIPDLPFIAVNGRTGQGKANLLNAVEQALATSVGNTVHSSDASNTDKPHVSSTQITAATLRGEVQGTQALAHAHNLAQASSEAEKPITATPTEIHDDNPSKQEISLSNPSPDVIPSPQGEAVPSRSASNEEVSQWVRNTSDRRFEWIAGIIREFEQPATNSKPTISDRLDSVLLHPVAGIIVFLVVMFAVFEATTTLAGPLNDWFDVTLREWITDAINWIFTTVAGSGSLDGWFYSLIVNGFLDGVITVCTFIAPMGIMFIVLSLLEDSGYLARAAFVMDKAMRAIGLDGRAFLPLVVGFGCNLPALASTRTLPDSRQRLLTGLLIPFTSCSARLSVYIVLAYAFFEQYAGLAIFLMYVSSILIILAVGFVLRKTQFKDLQNQPFAMGLPSYQMPRLVQLGKSVVVRLWAFITGASSIIITMIVIMWFLAAIPVSAGAQGTNSFGNVDNVEHSLYGTIASGVAPVFAPAGFDDWHASAALITGFVAKEVVVGSMSQSYSINSSSDQTEAEQGEGTLGQAVRASFEKSSHGHGSAAAAAFMIFVLAYTPCLATVAEMRRQYGGKIAFQAVVVGLLVAYVLAVVIFQIGRLL